MNITLDFYLKNEKIILIQKRFQSFQSYPQHLVEPSPWPIVTSLALLTLTVSAVLYFHGYPFGGILLLLGFILTALGMVFWFKDVVQEGTIKTVKKIFN